eukprot:NODE_256_length_11672_cov_0.220168.p7 type:complete len:165 gc:universal NODE_256_length_11672_cov_0.220168:9173-8679(-)
MDPFAMTQTIYDFKATLNGKDVSMSEYKGKALLIVNTATECLYAKQFTGLEELHQKYKDQGLAILGFPCNQFNGQEPLEGDEIAIACKRNHGVTFPLFAKLDVNGENAHPLFEYLKTSKKGILGTTSIKWNFTKFLVDKDGNVLKRYSPQDDPLKFEDDIKKLL